MYVKIGTKNYTKIRNLSFAPETVVSGSTVPINEFSCDVVTDDSLTAGVGAKLYDEGDNLWASYWVIYAEKATYSSTPGKTVWRLRAQSRLALLEREKMVATMYSSTALSTVLSAIFAPLGASSYTVDSSFSSATISGFCPEQTARERLQWVCLVLGAYVKTYFTETVDICALSQAETLIPFEKCFWLPNVEYGDYVTAVKVKSYSYTAGTPATTDTWVTDGTTTWIQTEQEVTLTNTDVPQDVPTKDIEVYGVGIINSSNVSTILPHLALYYFKRMKADVGILNNGEYMPGMRVIVPTSEDSLAVGYVETCTFGFGLQARSQLSLTPVEVKPSAKLSVVYKYGNQQLGKQVFLLPIGYDYTITNSWFDQWRGMHRYVFRPLTANITGTLSEATTVTVPYAIALDWLNSILNVISVDEVDVDDEIGVIS